MAEEQAAPKSQSPSRKGMFRLIMLVAVVMLASAAGAATAVLLSGGSGEPEQPVESEQDVLSEYLNAENNSTYEYVDFPTITTNLDEARLA